jgi:hypothetical protein
MVEEDPVGCDRQMFYFGNSITGMIHHGRRQFTARQTRPAFPDLGRFGAF